MRRLTVILLTVFGLHADAAIPSNDSIIVHVLNRITFGPRPGDIERVRDMGLDKYIHEQLQPEGLNDVRVAPGDDEQPVRALAERKIVRAIRSERQLEEVLTDFWFNHFNVDARKGPVRLMIADYEREAIRPHVLGRFRDLLGATASSPAMLFYLDNWMSNVRKGLNENYARELMELHTLGVDGGYTQRDVTEVARAFTGWTIDRPREGGGFVFKPSLHDDGEKVVLGRRIRPGGGMRDGNAVLDILAAHPSTARFIATKLARHFVSDTPPPALVARAAAKFRDTGGNLREVMRTILTSHEFLSAIDEPKMKTPLEFVVSAVRALDADVEPRTLVRALQQLGMPLYQCQPPTGYKDTADAWINTGALVARMNVASRLAKADQTLALALGSPEFQRR
jgi:uncharacterized protein (DUF1800 family)